MHQNRQPPPATLDELDEIETRPFYKCSVDPTARVVCVPLDPRAPQFRREYQGQLLGQPIVGRPLVMELDERRRLITSAVVSVVARESGELIVDTENNRYCVHRVIRWG